MLAMARKDTLLPDGEVDRRIRQLLTDRMNELTARIELIEEEQHRSLDDDSEEQAIERADDEPLDAIERAALAEIDQIKLALRRLSDGTYGRCISCGEAIDPRRLLVMPAATTCIFCAAAAGD
jgi:DnaK suppressor protein